MMKREIRKTNPIATSFLSIIPGLGQIYAGALLRGFAIMLGLTIQLLIFNYQPDSFKANYARMAPLSYWLILVWLWNIWDAGQVAKGIKGSVAFPVLVIFFLNLFASFYITDVHIPKLQPEQRNIIRQITTSLTSPDMFISKTIKQEAVAKFVVLDEGEEEREVTTTLKSDGPKIRVEKSILKTGEKSKIFGEGFDPDMDGEIYIVAGSEIDIAEFKTDKNGEFEVEFTNPVKYPGDYFLRARAQKPTGGWMLSQTVTDAMPRMFETIYLALLGTALSLIFAIPLSFLGARNLMSGTPILRLIYGIVRAVFGVLRSVEVLIIAVIAIAAVGIGPFAGVIALAIHGIGAVGKLYSEAIESIEQGPIEAIRATGANELQVVIYAVLPQVVPQFIAFTMYRWDINVRMATVIGLVGGGGIGFQLIQYMNLLQWHQAATCIWMIAIVVMIMDYFSAVIREKVV
ncbi:MAG: phosphonate ABC transporter, permease protein PhnE [Armatimonadota bacterium]